MENSIDELTLKLMSNKNQYNKYLSKSNPDKYKEHTDYLEKRADYSNNIMNTVRDILISNKNITTEVNESFEQFVKSCMKYYDMKSLEKHADNDDVDDDDMLFGNMDDSIGSGSNPESTNKNITQYAYWGKKDSKMNPNTNMSNYMYGISP
jgi:hypothetical protein